MIFKGISRVFELTDEQQYETIGQFWDEMAALHGLENLRGLGYMWQENTLSYAIVLKNGDIKNHIRKPMVFGLFIWSCKTVSETQKTRYS